jgi:hypothetical protein
LLNRVNKWSYQGIYSTNDFEKFADRWFENDKFGNYKGIRFIDVDTKKVIFEIKR